MEDRMSGQFPPAETFVFDIVCTNKGQHKRTRITKITIHPDGSAKWRAGRSFHTPTNSDAWGPIPTRKDGEPNNVFVMDCGRCPRWVELQLEKFRLLVPTLITHGVTRLDISDLPF
jgi:hypothetical protein